MKCTGCDNCKPVIHLSWMCSGELHQSDVCFECLHDESAVQDPHAVQLVQFLQDSNNNSQNDLRMSCTEAQERCPVCSYPLSHFKETGRAGCSDCYTYICEEELAVLLELNQRGLQHKGKVPEIVTSSYSPKSCSGKGKINSNSAENDLGYSMHG